MIHDNWSSKYRHLHSSVQAYYEEFFPIRSMAAANTAFLLQARVVSQVCQFSMSVFYSHFVWFGENKCDPTTNVAGFQIRGRFIN